MSKIRVKHASFREGVPQLQSRQNIATTAGGGAALVQSIEAIGPGLLVSLEDRDVLVPWPMVVGCVLEREAPPVDNDHVAPGCEQFTPEQIAANRKKGGRAA